MPFNKDELILDRVRSATFSDPATGEMLFRLTSIEEPSLACTAEGEEVTDALGSTITTLYRAKKATFSGTNSFFNFSLAAAQYGAKKVVADTNHKIKIPAYDILEIADGTVTTSKKPKSVDDIKYIYSLVDGEIATSYKAGPEATETTFAVAEGGVITVPTNLKGKIYVEYEYEAENAMGITNKSNEFPTTGSLKVFAYFRDKCNDNLVYSGVIISQKAKLNPESIELALTSTGKHGFEFQINKNYCDTEGDLFSIIVAQ